MRIVVFGAGAIGSLLGGTLARGGHTVLLIGRPDHVAAIRAEGLRLTGRIEHTVRLAAETSVPSDFGAEAVILGAKTFDLPSAAGLLALEVASPVPTLLPQNGLGIEDPVRAALAAGGWPEPERWVVRAVNSLPATLVGPGEVRAAGNGEIVLGFAKGPAAEATRFFAMLLRGAGIPTRSVRDLEKELWRKALVNAAINPVTALHGVPNGRLLEEPYRAESERLLLEALATARVYGFSFPDREVRADLERIVRATAENRSSMLQDLDRGRPTEVQAISGEILRRAATKGLDLPATRAAVDAIRARSRRSAPARGKPS
ncbi:MAG: 2-dehydropantoate 2-reductase [Thermoplasmata archaeon]|nr:2-dehydropantoate 2-reductase [Thermoplasmata archaeon]